jgi:hypothetical protein
MRIYQFSNCVVRHDPRLSYTETRFNDGSVARSMSTGTHEQLAMAYQLGYGGDCATLCAEHEILHTFVSEKLGLPHSPAIWAAAHGQPPVAEALWEQYQEDEIVYALQAWLNGQPASPALQSLALRGVDLNVLRREALSLLRAPHFSRAAA